MLHSFVETLPGGQASGMRPSDFDPASLYQGQRVEMEHTSSPRIALEIAMDHLAEDPDYYRKLATIHLDGQRLSAEPKIEAWYKDPMIWLGVAVGTVAVGFSGWAMYRALR